MLLPKKRVQHEPNNLSQDDAFMLSPIEVAERLVEFFVSIGKNIAINISVDIDTAPGFKTNSSSMFLGDVTAVESQSNIR